MIDGRILVTGGTGFLGRCIVRELAESGSRLRLLVRPTASRERFPATVEFASGDVTDRVSLDAAARDCRAIVHAAALVKIAAPAAEFDRINVGGLENVLAAAQAARSERVLHVSSFMALGPTEGGRGGLLDETAEPRDRQWINSYERTKTLADRVARAAIAAGVPLSVVYPAVIYGPGELTEGNIVVRHVLDLLRRKLPVLLGRPERRWSYAYVDDVARGVRLALEATPGDRYVLGGENIRQDDFYRLIGDLTDVPMPRRRIADWLAKTLGAVEKTIASWRGLTPKLTPDLVEVYRHDWAYDSSHAREKLGYSARPLREGMSETLAWLKESGAWRG